MHTPPNRANFVSAVFIPPNDFLPFDRGYMHDAKKSKNLDLLNRRFSLTVRPKRLVFVGKFFVSSKTAKCLAASRPLADVAVRRNTVDRHSIESYGGAYRS